MRLPSFPSEAFSSRLNLGALEPHWQLTRSWWTERSQREQLLLGSLAAMGIVALLLIAIIAPLRSAQADALAQIRNAALLEARLRAGGSVAGSSGKVRRGTASAILTDSAAAAKLAIQRIEPEGTNTRVVLADAPFDQVLQWIADIEQTSRLRVVTADIERKGMAGIVSATLVVSG